MVDQRDERRAFLPECFEVLLIVVAGAIEPHDVDDAQPLVGEGTDGGVVAMTFGALLLVVGFGPRAPSG